LYYRSFRIVRTVRPGELQNGYKIYIGWGPQHEDEPPIFRPTLPFVRGTQTSEDAARASSAAPGPSAPADREQAERVAWRQWLLWLKVQLALTDVGMTTASEVFFPYRLADRRRGPATLYGPFEKRDRAGY
jgi:hypothetical protein